MIFVKFLRTSFFRTPQDDYFYNYTLLSAEEHEAFEKRKKEAEQANERLRSEDVVRLNIPMGACWEQFMSEEIVTDFYSNAIRGKSNAIK